MANILIAEDEPAIAALMERSLSLVGHKVECAGDGREALRVFLKGSFDLALLDIMMPGLDGLTLKARLPASLPVIFVSAKNAVADQLKGLGMGADDYITKPFDMLVLLARVEAVLRRTCKNEQGLTVGCCHIDLQKRCALVAGVPVPLTPQEFNLLEVLVRNRNLALSREKLLELAWGFDYEGDTRTVDVHIQKLRRKLRLENEICTVYKYGYRLETGTAGSGGDNGEKR